MVKIKSWSKSRLRSKLGVGLSAKVNNKVQIELYQKVRNKANIR